MRLFATTLSWRRILLLTVAFALLLLTGTLVVVRQTGAVKHLVETALQQLLAAKFTLQDAHVDLADGVLTIADLRVEDPRLPGTDLLRCERARLAVDTNPLGELLAVREVTLDGLQLHLDLSQPLPALQLLLRPRTSEDRRRLPPIALHRAQVRLRVAADAPVLEFDDIELQVLPERDGGGRMVLDGSMSCDNLQVPMQLRGVGDPEQGTCRVTAGLGDARIDAALMARLQPFLSFQLPTEDVAGDLQRLQLWFELQPATAGAEAGAHFGFAADVAHVVCTLPDLPYPLRDGSVQLSASTRDCGHCRLRLRQHSDAGELEVLASVSALLTSAPQFELRGSGKAIRIDATSLAALQSFRIGRNIVTALDPTRGTADVDIYLRDPGLADPIVEVDVAVRDADLRYIGFGSQRRIGFPLQLRQASGRVRVRDDVIQLLDIEAAIDEAAGGGKVTCSGRVVTGGDDERVDIDVDAAAVRFTPALRAAVAEVLDGGGELYDMFAPDGTAAVAVRVRTADADDTWQVRVVPTAVTAAYQAFPYRVLLDGGQVLARASGIDIDVHGRPDDDRDSSLQITGRLLPDPGGALGDGSMELHVEARAAPIDSRLRRAGVELLPEMAPVWDVLRPEGRAECDLVVWRDGGAKTPRYDLRLQVHDALIRPTPLDLLVENVHGTIYAAGQGHDHHIDVDALRGSVTTAPDSKPAEIAVVGTMASHRPIGADFTAVIRDLHLDPTLAGALSRIDVLDRSTWDVLQPSGVVDCLLHWQRATPTSKPTERVTVHLRDVRSDAPMLPQAATEVSGDLEVKDGVVTFQDVHANIGQATVICSTGHVRPAADGKRKEVAFTVSSERFPLNDDITRLFEGPLKQSLLDRQMRGAVNVDSLSLTFLIPPGDTKVGFETIMAGRFEAVDVTMLAGARVEGINGIFRLDESHIDDAGGSLRGTIEKGSFRLFRHPCTDLGAGFVADARQIELTDLGFSLHNGRVRSPTPGAVALRYEFAPPGSDDGVLALDLTWDGISLSELLRQSGWSGYHFHGSMLGELHLQRLRGIDFVDMAARGKLAIVDGDLGTVPLFTAIYAQLSEDNRPRFESGNLDFSIDDRTMQIHQLKLRSPMLSVDGSGTMTMDGYLDVTLALDNLFGSSADLLVLPFFVKDLARRLVRFHLFGYLRDLQAEQRWFTERMPKRRPLLPVPPRLEKQKRPDF